MTFDDTRNYWVDNPDERVLICVGCGFQSADEVTFVAHCRTHETGAHHRPDSYDAAACQLVAYAYDVWLEGDAA